MDENIVLSPRLNSTLRKNTNQNDDAKSQVRKKNVKMKHNKWTVLLVEVNYKQVNICR